jgi:ribosome-associated protein
MTQQSLPENELVELAVKELFNRKAQDVAVLDLRGLSNLTDWIVVATCQSEVQLSSALGGVRRVLRTEHTPALGAEAGPKARWGVLDYGTVIVHVFLAEAREFYQLERLWRDAPRRECKAEDYPVPTYEATESFEADEEQW